MLNNIVDWKCATPEEVPDSLLSKGTIKSPGDKDPLSTCMSTEKVLIFAFPFPSSVTSPVISCNVKAEALLSTGVTLHNPIDKSKAFV